MAFANEEYDFAQLSKTCPELQQYVIIDDNGRGRIDFSSAEAVRALTVAIMRSSYGLRIEIPLDRLIPRVPNRLNYIQWISQLLESTPFSSPLAAVHGIDIGSFLFQATFAFFRGDNK